MWRCERCDENIPESLGCCWNCGTMTDGTEDPFFQAEPNDATVPDPGPGSEEIERHSIKIGPPQFSLRSLMIVVALVAIVSAILSEFWKNERRERAILEQLRPYGAQAYFQFGSLRTLRFSQAGEPLGDDMLPVVREFHKLRNLDLTYTDVTPAGIAQLDGMSSLSVIIVDEAKISQKAASQLFQQGHYGRGYVFMEVRPGQRPITKQTSGRPNGPWGIE